MITPDTKWSQRLLNICFIVLIFYFGIASLGKIYEIYTSIIAIHNLQERIDRLERRRSNRLNGKQNIRSVSLCGSERAANDCALHACGLQCVIAVLRCTKLRALRWGRGSHLGYGAPRCSRRLDRLAPPLMWRPDPSSGP